MSDINDFEAIELMVSERSDGTLRQTVKNIEVEVATVLAKRDDYSQEVLLAIGWCDSLLSHISDLQRQVEEMTIYNRGNKGMAGILAEAVGEWKAKCASHRGALEKIGGKMCVSRCHGGDGFRPMDRNDWCPVCIARTELEAKDD